LLFFLFFPSQFIASSSWYFHQRRSSQLPGKEFQLHFRQDDPIDNIGNFSLGLLESFCFKEIKECVNSFREEAVFIWDQLVAISQEKGWIKDPTSSYSVANSSVSYGQFFNQLLDSISKVAVKCQVLDLQKILAQLALESAKWASVIFRVINFLIYYIEFMTHFNNAITAAEMEEYYTVGFETGEMIKLVAYNPCSPSSLVSSSHSQLSLNYDDCAPAPWIQCSNYCCKSVSGSVCCPEPCVSYNKVPENWMLEQPQYFGSVCCSNGGFARCTSQSNPANGNCYDPQLDICCKTGIVCRPPCTCEDDEWGPWCKCW